MNRTHILHAFGSQPWAVMPSVLAEMRARLMALPESFTEQDVAPMAVKAPSRGQGAIGVISLRGVMSQRPTLFSMIFGGSTYESIGSQLQALVAEPSVSGIMLDIDSPGGSVFGLPELADQIYSARAQKPIVAVADSTCASAAYFLASQAHEIIATPSAQVGSIGTIYEHVDASQALEQAGIKVTYVAAGKYKTEGYEPLDDAAIAHLQSIADDYYGQFVNAVARGRGVKASDVRSGYGEGRVVTSKNALSLNLVDRVGTFSDAMARISNPRIPLGALQNHTVAIGDSGPVTVYQGSYTDTSLTSDTTTTSGLLWSKIGTIGPFVPFNGDPEDQPIDEPDPIPEPPPIPVPEPSGRSNESYRALARALTN